MIEIPNPFKDRAAEKRRKLRNGLITAATAGIAVGAAVLTWWRAHQAGQREGPTQRSPSKRSQARPDGYGRSNRDKQKADHDHRDPRKQGKKGQSPQEQLAQSEQHAPQGRGENPRYGGA